jgi:hypothetical protein
VGGVEKKLMYCTQSGRVVAVIMDLPPSELHSTNRLTKNFLARRTTRCDTSMYAAKNQRVISFLS